MSDSSCFIPLFPEPCRAQLPDLFPSPFNNRPHPLAQQAGDELQGWLSRHGAGLHDFDAPEGGKMFGVLVVRDEAGRIGYLRGFSGMLGGEWLVKGFVPPVFDSGARQTFWPAGEAQLVAYRAEIEGLVQSPARQALLVEMARLQRQQDAEGVALKARHKARKGSRRRQRARGAETAAEVQALLARLALESQNDKRELRRWRAQWQSKTAALQAQLAEIEMQISALKTARAKRSKQLHQQLFATYVLTNRLAEQREISAFFEQQHPPGGAGDCAGPKLIHYALRHGLTPLALAEFWWGAAPKQGVRQHGRYYPACRGKCRPILPFMLRGLEVQPAPALGEGVDASAPAVVYEDEHLVVVNKPHGLLSVPGREVTDSVLRRMQQRYPDASGPLLVHRLDLSTSGLLLVAKCASIHKALQKQFIQRTIHKRYVAILSQALPEGVDEGLVSLPLRVDLDDRPRQLVCHRYGKAAQTRWRVVTRGEGSTRVYLYPVTGRTHQLRLHAAHPQGLNAPIKGDELYGDGDGRLRLHAECLGFTHPVSAQRLIFRVPAPF